VTLNLLEQISVGFIGAALLLGFMRMLIGPTAPDRVISADTMSVTVTAALTLVAAAFGSELYLDVALVYGALAFIGVIAIARVIEGRKS
jgi:multisubunit Na+/H+ antiporter MnhF subunit